MYLTGFADEAGSSIDQQIKATLELGWNNIESRNVNGKNITDISDEAFEDVYAKLQEAGVRINCFGSAIANWGKQVTDPNGGSLEEVRRAIPRMKRLGTKLVRIMSYAVLPDRGPEDQMIDERVERLGEICKMFTDEGIQPVHENCMNYGGMGYTYTLELIEKVPGLKLVFDTGNPVFTDDRTKPKPYPKQSSWDFYSQIKEHIAYVHIKDGCYIKEASHSIFPEVEYTFPGDGDGDVHRIVKNLIDDGYDGGFSMEPHLSVVFHDAGVQFEDDIKYANYVEYGQHFMQLLEEIDKL